MSHMTYMRVRCSKLGSGGPQREATKAYSSRRDRGPARSLWPSESGSGSLSAGHLSLRQLRSTQRLRAPVPCNDELAPRASLRDSSGRRPSWGDGTPPTPESAAGLLGIKRIHRLCADEGRSRSFRRARYMREPQPLPITASPSYCLSCSRDDADTSFYRGQKQKATRRRASALWDRSTRSAPGAILGFHPGGVAQLVERYVRNVEVGGSSPLTSTGLCWQISRIMPAQG